MKTTLNIDDALFRLAKRRAADTGSTLTSVVEDALRAHLSQRSRGGGRRFRWIVVNDTDLPPVDIGNRRDLEDFLRVSP
ncbi:MAG: type II toxin-antitoxin system VapB family antitoxin [Actinomycetota bacterium]